MADVVLFAYNFCPNRRNFFKQTKISAYIVVNSFREILFCYRFLIIIYLDKRINRYIIIRVFALTDFVPRVCPKGRLPQDVFVPRFLPRATVPQEVLIPGDSPEG